MQGQEAQKKTGIASRFLILILTGACCGIAAGSACVLFAWLTGFCDDTFREHD